MTLLSLLRGSARTEGRLTDWGDWTPSRSAAGRVDEVTAYALSGVWACQTLIADAIATMPIDTYEVGSYSSPVPRPGWIDRPNPESMQVDFDTTRLLSLLGWGDTFALLVRGWGTSDERDSVVERWVLDPWRVDVRKEGNERRWYVDGQRVPAGNIQQISGYRLPQSMRGMSVVSNARQSLSLGMQAETMGDQMMRNGLNPSGVLQVPAMPEDIEEGVVEQLRDQVSQRHGGSGNSGKPMVLTGGTTWNPMSLTPVDAQWLETRRFQIDEVCRWFRVPPHMIGQVDRSTSWGTGIEQQSLSFVRYTLNAWLVRLEQADSMLMPPGQRVRYNVNSLAKADLKTRFEAYRIGREGGWLSANDVRVREDEQPIPNGNIYLQPLNFQEAGADPTPDPTTDDPTPEDPDAA